MIRVSQGAAVGVGSQAQAERSCSPCHRPCGVPGVRRGLESAGLGAMTAPGMPHLRDHVTKLHRGGRLRSGQGGGGVGGGWKLGGLI